jgi:hypothetical protein
MNLNAKRYDIALRTRLSIPHMKLAVRPGTRCRYFMRLHVAYDRFRISNRNVARRLDLTWTT